MRVFSFLSGAVLLLLMPMHLRAQWPGEVHGRVVDALSGRPVAAAEVSLRPGPHSTLPDARGAFRLRGLDPGEYLLRVTALGYGEHEAPVVVENGRVVEVEVSLVPAALDIRGLVASVRRGNAGVVVLDRVELERSSASTVGEALARVPGVVISSRGPGGSETPTIRGSSEDAVLVLLDGAPLNDPVTGEADLSTVPLSSLSSIAVLPGGRSVEYGAGATGGVVLLETRDRDPVTELAMAVGSLGERRLEGLGALPLAGGTLDLRGSIRELDGGFTFELPASVGGGERTRENADVRLLSAGMGWAASGERSSYDLRLGLERVERGLPGRSFAPSRQGRQELDRARLTLSFDTDRPSRGLLRANGYLVGQRNAFRDPHPPQGLAFDDEARVAGAGGSLRLSTRRPGPLEAAALGLEASWLGVESTSLDPERGRVSRTDAGVWTSASLLTGVGVSLTASARLDRSGLPARWYGSHDLGASWAGGGLALRLAHRSSFSPPTLGDQLFREGVGVEPNPDLEAERVPSEWVVGASWEGAVAGARLDLDGEAYLGAVDGMIVWLPDFRFVWSPRNMDVDRHGLDLRASLSSPARGWELHGSGSWNRATYDRAGGDDVQVAYRPELTGAAGASFTRRGWSGGVDLHFIGARFPVPNAVNELPGFWTTSLHAARRWAWGPVGGAVRLEVDRLFDHENTLIFAFPDPGRVARLSVRLGPHR